MTQTISFASKKTMKLLAVVSFFVAVCAESTIPVVPGDNSHYVEGVSRYIWMPDGEGNPLLVDLHAPVPVNFLLTRKGKDNKYFLYTRQNRKHYQVLVKGDVKSISNSNYRDDRPTKIITHGWMSNGKTKWIKQLKDAFLDDADVNVIILDWSSAAIGLYTSAVHAVPDVGVHVARLLDFVFDTAGGNWDNVHLVGHSLGAHVMGNAGRAASSRPMRVTGLDPAGPQWGGNAKALNRSSATYVESIHTDGGVLGIFDPISHADFYPNGGRSFQPGCFTNFCSHSRSQSLFTSTLRSNHLQGRLCADLDEARRNECTGPPFVMGNSELSKRGSGLYALSTGSKYPY